jgi:transposase
MTPDEFLCWLINANLVTIIFEACGTSNYWRQQAIEAGHDTRLICAKLLSTIRQNQKTYKNDALAFIQAALLPDITFISGKRIGSSNYSRFSALRN